MIRYVLAVLLAVTVLGMTATALDHASTVRAEESVEADIETIGQAATALLEHETQAETAGPRRIVEIELPERSFTVAGTDQLVFEPVPDSGVTRVHYEVEGGAAKQTTLDGVIGRTGRKQLDLSHLQGDNRLKLTLEATGDGERYVSVTDVAGGDI